MVIFRIPQKGGGTSFTSFYTRKCSRDGLVKYSQPDYLPEETARAHVYQLSTDYLAEPTIHEDAQVDDRDNVKQTK